MNKTNTAPKKPFHEQFAEKIIAMLEAGTAPWQRPWTPAENLAPRNPVSGTVYKGVNRLNLALSGYDDPRWMTLKQANDAGYRIKKGSHATMIAFYQFNREEDKLDTNGEVVLDKDGKPEKEKVRLEKPILRFSLVFNGTQIEGLPPLEKKEVKHEWTPHERAESILERSGAVIKHDQPDRNFYRPWTDEIHLTPKDSFDTSDKYYATALHELGHWTGHPSRINREFGPFGSTTYAREELRAEIASWMLGQDIGVGHDPGQHAAYVQSWIRDLRDNPMEIMRICRDAEQIKDYILGLEHQKELGEEHSLEADSPAVAARETPPARPALEKTWLAVPYVEREDAKNCGAKWDAKEKRWYAPKGADLDKLAAWLPEKQREREPEAIAAREVPEASGRPAPEKTWLAVPFKEKEQAKRLGAKWDRTHQCWYAPEGADLEVFSRWLDVDRKLAPAATLSPQEEFARQLADLGLDLKGQLPELDGKTHRVPLLSKNGRGLDGAYCLHGDGIPAGWAQNHSTGEKIKLVATGVVLSPAERERQKAERAARLEQAERERAQARDAAAERCRGLWDSFEPAGNHPYLEKKGVAAFGLRQDQGNLIIPLRNVDGDLRGIQAIGPDGQKSFASGMEKKGNFHLLGGDGKDLSQGEIILCEGYATGASLHMATGKPVAVAFDSGNLLSVAEALRSRYPNAAMTICADNDHAMKRDGKPYNVGLEKARATAQAVNAKVIAPTFTSDEAARGLTDFNDLHQSRGLDAVKMQLGVREQSRGMER